MPGAKFVRCTDIAKQLGVKVETVTAWIRAGDLPAFDVGSKRPQYRIAPEDVAAFIERRKVAPEIKSGAPVRRRTAPGEVNYFDPKTGKELHTKPVPNVQHRPD